MSVLGAILGKRTWLGAGAILLSAAGGCALGALLVVKGVLPETGTLAWSCGCWVLASFEGRVWPSGAGERGPCQRRWQRLWLRTRWHGWQASLWETRPSGRAACI